jgi:glycosyltransferase involved in cell wall biosynthesis
MPIDVIVLTKNSERMLRECLCSVYRNVPVNRLIIVDGYSTDKTLDVVEEFQRKHGNVLLLQDRGNRATARQKGISRVETEWFMFVDSDVVLSRGWFRKAKKHIAADVGAVWGVNIDVIPNMKDKHILKLQSLIARQFFCVRGGMHDTLIRREAVEGIHIPEQLHAYEDAYIVNWIKEKGYKIVVGDDIYCLHFKPPANWSLHNGVSQAIIDFRCGVLYSHLYSYIFYYPIFMIQWFLQLSIHGTRGLLTSQRKPKMI